MMTGFVPERIKGESKERRGGKRFGAGRKPSTIKGIVKKLPKMTAELILSEINAHSKWKELANCKDVRIQFEVLRYLTDRAYGKPSQAIEHSGPGGGPIEHAHVDLTNLSDEQIRQVELLVESAADIGADTQRALPQRSTVMGPELDAD